MAEKNNNRGKKSIAHRSGNAGGNRQHNEENSGGFALSGAKMERLYDVLEAFIDTLDIPRNRGRAIKYGIRAIGEFMTPENDTRASRTRGDQGGNTRASLADDEQQSEGSGSMRRG